MRLLPYFVCKDIGCVCLFKSYFVVGIHLICDGHARYSAPTKELFSVKSLPKLQRTSRAHMTKLNGFLRFFYLRSISFGLHSSLKSRICRGNLLFLELFPLTSSYQILIDGWNAARGIDVTHCEKCLDRPVNRRWTYALVHVPVHISWGIIRYVSWRSRELHTYVTVTMRMSLP